MKTSTIDMQSPIIKEKNIQNGQRMELQSSDSIMLSSLKQMSDTCKIAKTLIIKKKNFPMLAPSLYH